MDNKKGQLVVFEGPDGAGKSIAVSIFKDLLKQKFGEDREVIQVRAPDGPIRDILLNREHGVLVPNAELLLFVAGHLWVYENKIKPALERGAIVVMDRFYYSTMAYQAYGRDLYDEFMSLVPMFEHIKIDAAVFIEASPEKCDERLSLRQNLDFMDTEAADFKRKVRFGYRTVCEDMHKDALSDLKIWSISPKKVLIVKNESDDVGNLTSSLESVILLLFK